MNIMKKLENPIMLSTTRLSGDIYSFDFAKNTKLYLVVMI